MSGQRKVDIFDLLPEEAMKAIDELGYNFLAEMGYDTTRAIESKTQRTKLKKEMRVKGEELRYAGAVDHETKAILVWFELWKGKDRIATSRGIKLLPKASEGGEDGGEGSQAGSSTAPNDNT